MKYQFTYSIRFAIQVERGYFYLRVGKWEFERIAA